MPSRTKRTSPAGRGIDARGASFGRARHSAIKGLGQFERFKAASAFRLMIENWHISDFHVSEASQPGRGFAEHLSTRATIFPANYLFEHHRDRFDRVLLVMQRRVPAYRWWNPSRPRTAGWCSASRMAASRILSSLATCRMARSRCLPIWCCSMIQSPIRCWPLRSPRISSTLNCFPNWPRNSATMPSVAGKSSYRLILRISSTR